MDESITLKSVYHLRNDPPTTKPVAGPTIAARLKIAANTVKKGCIGTTDHYLQVVPMDRWSLQAGKKTMEF